MTEKKKKYSSTIFHLTDLRIDIHNNIATKILSEIEKRDLDKFFELEY